mmetsp:Transcript_3713/g.3234  ORF Transcript_3713/g.3234 Transcript_3713/m.3234 type:complete len:91 (+) Transcript_3713:389-661(+)
MDFKIKLSILIDIASGLKSMHSCNIAHMDLKLENVIRFDETFKIVDMESTIDFNYLINEDIEIKSSLPVMPPELYLFQLNKLSTNVDIWS